MENNEPATRVTRSLRKRLESTESVESPSRPGTPMLLTKFPTISEEGIVGSPVRRTRSTRSSISQTPVKKSPPKLKLKNTRSESKSPNQLPVEGKLRTRRNSKSPQSKSSVLLPSAISKATEHLNEKKTPKKTSRECIVKNDDSEIIVVAYVSSGDDSEKNGNTTKEKLLKPRTKILTESIEPHNDMDEKSKNIRGIDKNMIESKLKKSDLIVIDLLDDTREEEKEDIIAERKQMKCEKDTNPSNTNNTNKENIQIIHVETLITANAPTHSLQQNKSDLMSDLTHLDVNESSGKLLHVAFEGTKDDNQPKLVYPKTPSHAKSKSCIGKMEVENNLSSETGDISGIEELLSEEPLAENNGTLAQDGKTKTKNSTDTKEGEINLSSEVADNSVKAENASEDLFVEDCNASAQYQNHHEKTESSNDTKNMEKNLSSEITDISRKDKSSAEHLPEDGGALAQDGKNHTKTKSSTDTKKEEKNLSSLDLLPEYCNASVQDKVNVESSIPIIAANTSTETRTTLPTTPDKFLRSGKTYGESPTPPKLRDSSSKDQQQSPKSEKTITETNESNNQKNSSIATSSAKLASPEKNLETMNQHEKEKNSFAKSWCQNISGMSNTSIKFDTISTATQKIKQLSDITEKKNLILETETASPLYRNLELEVDSEEESAFEDLAQSLSKNDYIDDEAMEVDNYQSGDSMDEDERRELEENEILDDGESIGTKDSYDPDLIEDEEDERDSDSFVTSDTNEVEAKFSSCDEDGLQSEDDYPKAKSFKRIQIPISSDSEEETEIASPKTTVDDDDSPNQSVASEIDIEMLEAIPDDNVINIEQLNEEIENCKNRKSVTILSPSASNNSDKLNKSLILQKQTTDTKRNSLNKSEVMASEKQKIRECRSEEFNDSISQLHSADNDDIGLDDKLTKRRSIKLFKEIEQEENTNVYSVETYDTDEIDESFAYDEEDEEFQLEDVNLKTNSDPRIQKLMSSNSGRKLKMSSPKKSVKDKDNINLTAETKIDKIMPVAISNDTELKFKQTVESVVDNKNRKSINKSVTLLSPTASKISNDLNNPQKSSQSPNQSGDAKRTSLNYAEVIPAEKQKKTPKRQSKNTNSSLIDSTLQLNWTDGGIGVVDNVTKRRSNKSSKEIETERDIKEEQPQSSRLEIKQKKMKQQKLSKSASEAICTSSDEDESELPIFCQSLMLQREQEYESSTDEESSARTSPNAKKKLNLINPKGISITSDIKRYPLKRSSAVGSELTTQFDENFVVEHNNIGDNSNQPELDNQTKPMKKKSAIGGLSVSFEDHQSVMKPVRSNVRHSSFTIGVSVKEKSPIKILQQKNEAAVSSTIQHHKSDSKTAESVEVNENSKTINRSFSSGDVEEISNNVYEQNMSGVEEEVHGSQPWGAAKRKRLSKSFGGTDDLSIRHLHKKSKMNEMELQLHSSTPHNKGLISNTNRKKDDSINMSLILGRCDKLLEAANLAKLEAKLNDKKNKHKLSKNKKKVTKKLDREKIAVPLVSQKQEQQRKEKINLAVKQAIRASADILLNKDNKKKNPSLATIDEGKLESKRLPLEIVEAISVGEPSLKGKKHNRHALADVEVNRQTFTKLKSTAGNIVEMPGSPVVRKKKTHIEKMKLASGMVTVEPITPPRKKTLIQGFRESPITPRPIGFKVREILTAGQDTAPENSRKNRNRKHKLNFEEPTNVLPKPQWTQSGVFIEEKLPKTHLHAQHGATQFSVVSLKTSKNIASVDNAMNFKQNALFRSSVHRKKY